MPRRVRKPRGALGLPGRQLRPGSPRRLRFPVLCQHFVSPAFPAPLFPRIRTVSVLPVLIFAAVARFTAGASQRGGRHGTEGCERKGSLQRHLELHAPSPSSSDKDGHNEIRGLQSLCNRQRRPHLRVMRCDQRRTTSKVVSQPSRSGANHRGVVCAPWAAAALRAVRDRPLAHRRRRSRP